MNRILLITMAVMAFTIQSNAQSANKGFYIKVAGGYFFSVSPGQFPDVGPFSPRDEHNTINPGTGATTKIREKVLTGSYGEGVRGGVTGGYVINKHISVELTVNYFSSKKNLMTRSRTTIQGTDTEVGKIESKGHVQAVDIAPSIVFSPGYEKFNPYVRFGFVVPVWGRLYIETDASRTSPCCRTAFLCSSENCHSPQRRNSSQSTFGFQGALGCNYKINEKLGLFLEAEYRNVPVRSKNKEVTTYNENTKDHQYQYRSAGG